MNKIAIIVFCCMGIVSFLDQFSENKVVITPIYEKYPGSHVKIMIKKENGSTIEVKNVSGKITFATA